MRWHRLFSAQALTCWCRGHEDVREATATRLCVRCLRCGRLSVGIPLDPERAGLERAQAEALERAQAEALRQLHDAGYDVDDLRLEKRS